MSHTLPERARSSYGEEHNRRIFEGAIGSAVGGGRNPDRKEDGFDNVE
jgi:hypothetical protein